MSGFPSVQSQLIAVELYSKHTLPCKASVATVASVVALKPDASVGIEACEKNCQAGNKKYKKKQESIASLIVLLYKQIVRKSETQMTRMRIQRLDI